MAQIVDDFDIFMQYFHVVYLLGKKKILERFSF